MDKKRIEYLENKYSPTNVAKGEQLSKETRKHINQRYYRNVKRRMALNVINEANVTTIIEIEVLHIIEKIGDIKQLCRTCKEEQIIAVIILYIQRNYNKKLQEDKTYIWNKYNLTWKLHSRIISNMLRDYRKSVPLPRNSS